MRIRKPLAFLLCVLIAPAAPLAAQNETPAASAENLAAFFASEVPPLMEKHRVVGLAVSVADPSSLRYARGFGSAQLAENRAVDPQRTLFRAGSISKLFTWTAVMQLVEQGKLDLDRDVNEYLDFQLPDGPGGPITMRHLMNHTPGFEDRLIGLFYKDPARLGSLREAVASHIPRRVLPPGQEVSYSNYGVMLAGYIVERLSGMPYDDYVESRVFAPLHMENASFRQPLPARFASEAATGYAIEDMAQQPQLFELVNGAPAGALSISATDMARFLQSHMRAGAGLLRPQTAARMHRQSNSLQPGFNGMAHGFIELSINGHHVIGHGGDTIYFHSLAGIIEGRLGFFFSTNSASGAAAIAEMYRVFMNRFFPGQTGEQAAQAYTVSTDLSAYSGNYHATRRSESDLTKLFSLFMLVQVEEAEEGGLWIANPLTADRSRYLPVGAGLFQRIDGGERVLFFASAGEKIDSLMIEQAPVMTFRKAPFHESVYFALLAPNLSALILLIAMFARPTGCLALLPRYRAALSGEMLHALAASMTLSLSVLVYFVSVALSLGPDMIFDGAPSVWPFLIPYLSLISAAVCSGFAFRSWQKRWWGLSGRILYSSAPMAGMLLFFFLYQWHLVMR